MTDFRDRYRTISSSKILITLREKLLERIRGKLSKTDA